MLQFCYSPTLMAVYPLIVPEIADVTILYYRKVLKHLIVTSITSVSLQK